MGRARGTDQAAAVGVRQADLDLVSVDRGQRVEQVIHVEADLELFALVTDLDLVFRLFLLRIVRLSASAGSS